MGKNYEGMSDKKEYVYIYKRGDEEFITGSYQLALLRNSQDERIYVLSNEGVKYLLDE
jgi:hypothetical protein